MKTNTVTKRSVSIPPDVWQFLQSILAQHDGQLSPAIFATLRRSADFKRWQKQQKA